MQEHNLQIPTQDNLSPKFEIAVKFNNFVHHPLLLALPIITIQSLPPPFFTTDLNYKYDRYTKKDTWICNIL